MVIAIKLILLVYKILAAKIQYTSAAARRSTLYEYPGFCTVELVFGHLSGK